MALRNDISSLMGRLGRTDLPYREFVDPLGDMEMWPIFEALLHDPRIVGRAPTLLEQRRRASLPTGRTGATEMAPAESGAPAAHTPAQPPQPDRTLAGDPQLRSFLGQLGTPSGRGRHPR
jgi:hypothetical protein